MNNRIYVLDFKKLSVLLTPVILRKRVFVVWLGVLMNPLILLYKQFLEFTSLKRYELLITPQVCYLEKALNDVFDVADRRIYISDGVRHQMQYIYTIPEVKDQYLGTLYIRPSSDYGETGIDFIVWLPKGMKLSQSEQYMMRAILNKYKLAGRRYIIQIDE